MRLDDQQAKLIARAIYRDIHPYAQAHRAEFSAFLRKYSSEPKGPHHERKNLSRSK
jgi:hypothetical protein